MPLLLNHNFVISALNKVEVQNNSGNLPSSLRLNKKGRQAIFDGLRELSDRLHRINNRSDDIHEINPTTTKLRLIREGEKKLYIAVVKAIDSLPTDGTEGELRYELMKALDINLDQTFATFEYRGSFTSEHKKLQQKSIIIRKQIQAAETAIDAEREALKILHTELRYYTLDNSSATPDMSKIERHARRTNIVLFNNVDNTVEYDTNSNINPSKQNINQNPPRINVRYLNLKLHNVEASEKTLPKKYKLNKNNRQAILNNLQQQTESLLQAEKILSVMKSSGANTGEMLSKIKKMHAILLHDVKSAIRTLPYTSEKNELKTSLLKVLELTEKQQLVLPKESEKVKVIKRGVVRKKQTLSSRNNEYEILKAKISDARKQLVDLTNDINSRTLKTPRDVSVRAQTSCLSLDIIYNKKEAAHHLQAPRPKVPETNSMDAVETTQAARNTAIDPSKATKGSIFKRSLQKIASLGRSGGRNS